MPTPGRTTAARGYGYRHRRIRAALIESAYGTPCTRCGEVMNRGQALDLDHTDTRGGYLGFAHSSCNRAAGARKRSDVDPEPKRVTRWGK